MRLLLASALLLAGAPLAHAQVVLSGSYGRPITIGATTDAREAWVASSATAEKLVRDFQTACSGTEARTSLAGYTTEEAELPAAGKATAVTVTSLAAPGVRISFWNGDPLSLKGRASAIRDRGVVITGPVRDRDIAAGQCSLSARVTGLNAEALTSAMSAAFGTPTKTVLKPGFADGEWSVAGTSGVRTVRFSATDMKKPEQLLHISSIPERESK